MRISPKIEQISTHFNGVGVEIYLIQGERSVIIDTGTCESPKRDISPAMEAIGAKLSEVSLILNTHGHFDHTGGNIDIKAISGARIGIHRDDAAFLYDRKYCFEIYLAPVVKAMSGNLPLEKQAFLNLMGPNMLPDQELVEGDVIEAGSGVELIVISLPGHTQGSAGFFWEREGVLFCGDSLVGLHVAGGKLPIISNLPAYIESVKRVQGMPIRSLLCAHHFRGLDLPPSAVRRGAEVSQYLSDCEEFARRLEEAISKVGSRIYQRDFMEVADEIIAQLPNEMGFKPLSQAERPLFSAQTILFGLHSVNPQSTGNLTESEGHWR